MMQFPNLHAHFAQYNTNGQGETNFWKGKKRDMFFFWEKGVLIDGPWPMYIGRGNEATMLSAQQRGCQKVNEQKKLQQRC